MVKRRVWSITHKLYSISCIWYCFWRSRTCGPNSPAFSGFSARSFSIAARPATNIAGWQALVRLSHYRCWIYMDLHLPQLHWKALAKKGPENTRAIRQVNTNSWINLWSPPDHHRRVFFVKSPGHRPQMLSSLSNSDSGPLRHSSSRLKSSMLAALSNISWRCYEAIWAFYHFTQLFEWTCL